MKKKNKDRFKPGQRVFIKDANYHCFDDRSIGIIVEKWQDAPKETYDVKLTKKGYLGDLKQAVYACDLKRA